MSKPALTFTPEACAAGVLRHLTSEHAHKIVQGYWLLQAQAVFSQRGDGKTRSTGERVSASGDDCPGYGQWLDETFRGVLSRTTAQNYRVAASRCGITAEMTEAAALAAAEAKLAGVAKLSDLYKALPDGEKNDALPASPPAMKPEQLWFDFEHDLAGQFAPESPAMRALPRLSIPVIEAIERSLRAGLDQVSEILTRKRKAK